MNTKWHRIRVIATNTLMVVATLLIAGVLVLVAMGYTLNRSLNVEQTGLVQFISKPSGATVSIDGQALYAKTATKSNVTPVKHEFKISKDKYDTWSKKDDVNAGHVLWLNYARLLPLKKQVSTLDKFETLAAVSAAPKGNYMLALPSLKSATMQLLDIRGDQVKTTALDFAPVFSDMDVADITHQIQFTDWNVDNNKLLAIHRYNDQTEWVLLSIDNPKDSVNLTAEFKLNFSAVKFAANDGRKIWALENGNLRQIDIGNKTVTSVLVSNVAQFNIPKNDVVLFVSVADSAGLIKIGVYKNGDKFASTLYSVPSTAGSVTQIVGSRYFNEDYAIVLETNKLVIIKGDYPSFGRPAGSSQIKEIKLKFTPERLEMGRNGRFAFALNGNNVFNYDLETNRQTTFTLTGTHTQTEPLNWLDDYIIWTDKDNQLTIYDFDGNNKRDVMTLATGFVATLTANDRYIYSIIKKNEVYYLQRLDLVAK